MSTLLAILTSPAFGAAVGAFLGQLFLVARVRAVIRRDFRGVITDEAKVAVRAELEQLPAAELQQLQLAKVGR